MAAEAAFNIGYKYARIVRQVIQYATNMLKLTRFLPISSSDCRRLFRASHLLRNLLVAEVCNPLNLSNQTRRPSAALPRQIRATFFALRNSSTHNNCRCFLLWMYDKARCPESSVRTSLWLPVFRVFEKHVHSSLIIPVDNSLLIHQS